MATMVFCVAETLRWSIGREFECQVMVLFLQSPLSSCVVSKSLYKTSLIIYAVDNHKPMHM